MFCDTADKQPSNCRGQDKVRWTNEEKNLGSSLESQGLPTVAKELTQLTDKSRPTHEAKAYQEAMAVQTSWWALHHDL